MLWEREEEGEEEVRRNTPEWAGKKKHSLWIKKEILSRRHKSKGKALEMVKMTDKEEKPTTIIQEWAVVEADMTSKV